MSLSEPLPASCTLPCAVLDTNVVLDLWLFDDPRARPLREALDSGRLQALVTDAGLAELADVLQRPFVQAWPVLPQVVLGALQACSHRVSAPPCGTPPPPRCSDRADQKFVDLAWGWPAAWLLSRDKAVLKLARAARASGPQGLRIGTPEQWAAAQTRP